MVALAVQAAPASWGGQGAAPAVAAPAGSAYVPGEVCRLLDSRVDGGPLAPNAARSVDVAGHCGVPEGAAAVAVSVTVVAGERAGFVALWASGRPFPGTSNVNVRAHEIRSNAVIAELGPGGGVQVLANVAAHVVIDVVGHFTPAATATSGRYVPYGPLRVLDTREGTGPAPTTAVRVQAPTAVPADATALAVNITTTATSRGGWVTAVAAGDAPAGSLLSADGPGQTRAVGAIVPLRDGAFDLYSSAGDHLVVDVTGWFTGPSAAPGTDGLFVPAAPVRLVDTRAPTGPAGGPRLHRGGAREWDVGAITGGAAAVIANVTVVDARDDGWWQAYPAGTPRPFTSTVNAERPWQTVANLQLVPASTRGIAVFAQHPADLVVDVTGWFTGSPVAATEPPPPNLPVSDRTVVVIGDSSIAAVRWYAQSRDALRGFRPVLDLESCRRLVVTSCRGREGRTPPTALQALRGVPRERVDTLVMATGYNDADSRFAGDLATILAAAREHGYRQVVWLTYRESSGYVAPGRSVASGYAAMNDALRAAAASGEHPELVVADWWRYTSTAPEWFTADGIHYRQTAAFAMADYLSRWVAALDEVPCPAPWAPGQPADVPCPRPESVVADRGQADVSGLYGIGASGWFCVDRPTGATCTTR